MDCWRLAGRTPAPNAAAGPRRSRVETGVQSELHTELTRVAAGSQGDNGAVPTHAATA